MLHLFHPYYGFSEGSDLRSSDSLRKLMRVDDSIEKADDNIGIKLNKLLRRRRINVKKVVCGFGHIVFLITDNSSVYVLGQDSILSGAFDVPSELIDNGYFKEPYLIIDGKHTPVRDIIPGLSHNLFLTYDNDIYGCGNNDRMQMFTKSKQKKLFTVTKLTIPNIENPKIKFASSGHNFSIYITEDMRMFSSGVNNCGQCGVESSKDQLMSTIDFKSQITLIDPNASCEIVEIHSNQNSTIFRTSDGRLYGFGNHLYGCFGLNEDYERDYHEICRVGTGSKAFLKERCISFSCGLFFVCAITESNQLYVFGYNNFQQLSVKNTSTVYTPVHVRLLESPSFSNGIRNDYSGCVSRVVCGSYTTFAQSMENKIYVSGYFKDNSIFETFTCMNEFKFGESTTSVQISAGDSHAALLIHYDFISHLFPRLLPLLEKGQLVDVDFVFDSEIAF